MCRLRSDNSTRKNKTPGHIPARGVNPPSYITIIGTRKFEVDITLRPALQHLFHAC